MMRYAIALFLALAPVALGAEWQGRDGPFMAIAALTTDSDKIYDAWENGPANGVELSELPSVAPGLKLEAIVVFSGCAPDSKGNCQVVADLTIRAKDGTIIGGAGDIPLWVDRPAPIPGQLQIADQSFGLRTTLLHGSYEFRIVVRDNVGKRRVELTQRTEVIGT